jgi:hypothetical protein
LSVNNAPTGTLNVQGCFFPDPFNGASVGAIAPTAAGPVVIDNSTSPGDSYDITVMGSQAQNGAANYFTPYFLNIVNSGLAPRLGTTKSAFKRSALYVYPGSASGAFPIYPAFGIMQLILLTDNSTFPVNNAGKFNSDPGDKLTLEIQQNATGGFTATGFTNCRLAGGSFALATGAGDTSILHLEFDGTYWNEIGRALNVS